MRLNKLVGWLFWRISKTMQKQPGNHKPGPGDVNKLKSIFGNEY